MIPGSLKSEVDSTKKLPSYLNFDKDSYAWKPDVDYMKEPEKYRVGKGEQGVLICQPYKSELVALWKFETPAIAKTSSVALYKKFVEFLKNDDFVGADLTRKVLQMGFTRARRYANYKGGRKYDSENDYEQNEKGTGDPVKAESADIFFKAWKRAEANKEYARRKKEWVEQYG